jgi:hypothetical protein
MASKKSAKTSAPKGAQQPTAAAGTEMPGSEPDRAFCGPPWFVGVLSQFEQLENDLTRTAQRLRTLRETIEKANAQRKQ